MPELPEVETVVRARNWGHDNRTVLGKTVRVMSPISRLIAPKRHGTYGPPYYPKNMEACTVPYRLY